MPKKAMSAQERMDREFLAALAAGQVRTGDRDSDTARLLPNCKSTYYRRKREPGLFTVRDFRIIAQRYQLTDYQISRIFGVEYHGSTLA